MIFDLISMFQGHGFICCKSKNFHWIFHLWGPWCQNTNSRPRSHAGRRCPWTRCLEIMHAFQDSVLGFIQKRFSPDFIAKVQWGDGSTKRSSSEGDLEARSPFTRPFAMMQGSGPFLAWLAFMHELVLWFHWPCAHFADFSTSIFFSKIFLGSLYGAQQCLQNIFHEGGFFVEPLKKHDYKEALVIKIARFSRKTN